VLGVKGESAHYIPLEHSYPNNGNEREVKTMKKKICTTSMVASLMLLLVSVSILTVKAAPEITLTPSTGEPDDSVEVVGTGFAPDTIVGIGVGAEVETTDENMTYSGTGVGPYSGKASHWPIKPGSFVLNVDTTMSGGIISTYTDDGDGTLSGSFEGAFGDINYTTGEWSRTSTADLTGLVQVYSATYTCYEFNVTAAEGIVTDSVGEFTANITVPGVVNGEYSVTAIDELGNVATSGFEVIPEGLSFGVVVILSSLAVIVATLVFRKRSKIDK
jgi:hypothetical protein